MAAEIGMERVQEMPKGYRVHFVGIGGVGMAGSAEVLVNLGLEYGLDIRAVGFDVRNHDDNIFGQQLRVLFKCGQQMIVKHLDFTHGTVAEMNLNRRIGPCWQIF